MRRLLPKLALLMVSLLFAAILIETGFRLTTEAAPWYERLEGEQAGLYVPLQQVGDQRFKLRAPLEPIELKFSW